MAAARRRRLSRGVASLLLAPLVLLPVAATPTAASPAVAGDATLSITSITTVVEGDETATVQGRLTNTGPEPLAAPDVQLVPQEAGSRRSDIADWTQGTDPVSGTALDTAGLEDIEPGDSAAFVLRVDADELLPDAPAGAAWVSIQTDTTAVRTFVGVHRRKEYVPMRLLWGIPLLLPADERLYGPDSAGRTAAWQEATDSDSRLAQLTAEPPASDEAWVLDPSLLDVPTESTDSSIAPQERTARSALAEGLRERVVGSRTLVLPDADADVAAGTRSPQTRELVEPRVSRGAEIAEDLQARSDVLWPADGLASNDRAEALDRLHPDGGTMLMVPGSSLAPESFTPSGGTRTTGDTPLVVSDGPLSDLVGGLGSADDLVLARQQLVAETASVLGERAGTERTLVVMPDREATPDPSTWERLRASTQDIPWLEKGTLTSVLDDASQAEPVATARDRTQLREATASSPTRPAMLTPERAQQLLDDGESMRSFASVRSDGVQWSREMQREIGQLTSTRWRSSRQGYTEVQGRIADEVGLSEDDLVVSSADVNFFADTGRLQITIVNKTDVELSNLVVRLDPDSPSLRIDGDPDPVTIGPEGRHTVTVTASALAAGQVPVNVTVATPGGQQVAQPATLRVKVRPTGASIYWIIGGLAALLLVAGTWRTVRGGSRSARTEVVPTKES